MDDFDNDAMAQAMGFASFGAQKPPSSKRRKFNPAADAVVAAPDPSTLPPRPPPSSASNAVPLGIRSRTANSDEINLDDHDDDNDDNDEKRAEVAISNQSGTPLEVLNESISTAEGSNSAGQSINPESRTNQSGNGGARARRQPAKTNWWADYYDPSSVINPWERLEQDRGLQPRGSWLTWEEAKSKP